MSHAESITTVRIATRESPLALWQAHFIRDQLLAVSPDCQVDLCKVTTSGDRDRTSALSSLGGVGVFTREVQRAVLEGTADIAVHSLKDLPTDSVAGLQLAGVPEREARFDALVLPLGHSGGLDSLPLGARVGTGSLRRKSQLLVIRPDLQIDEVRGNVETRLAKVDRGEYHAVVLAEAGLRRLGWEARISQILSPPMMFPAVGQAALGVECRAADVGIAGLLRVISHVETLSEVLAERACLRALRAGCHAPVGVLSAVAGDQLSLQAVVLTADGRQSFKSHVQGTVNAPEELGRRAAEELLRQGADVALRRPE